MGVAKILSGTSLLAKIVFLTPARGLEHVLSYQRRVHATKQSFLKRNVLTPLGIARDWWDRKGIVYAFDATYLIQLLRHCPNIS